MRCNLQSNMQLEQDFESYNDIFFGMFNYLEVFHPLLVTSLPETSMVLT